jgi:hypothetical protein
VERTNDLLGCGARKYFYLQSEHYMDEVLTTNKIISHGFIFIRVSLRSDRGVPAVIWFALIFAYVRDSE